MKHYPKTATERFDNAFFHINYCLSFFKKYIKGNILEVGAGCGSFTKNYYNSQIENLILTEKDQKNINDLKKRFKKEKNINILNSSIEEVNEQCDTIIYLHVLEHIRDDIKELENAKKKLANNGHLIIMVPAHQKIFSNLDKAVGHFRRYEKEFFDKDFNSLKLVNFKYLDSMGYILYFLNRIFFKNETFPSKLKIFIWDKIFTPLSVIVDFLTLYRFGKCIIAVYKKF
tara:strand:- start:2792 stop:3478 length:687 start_codon:yes stop_codon:yes gene_type:complete